MPPRRRRSSISSISNSGSKGESDIHSFQLTDGTAPDDCQDSQVTLPVLGASFEFEEFNEWWTAPPAAAAVMPSCGDDEKQHSSYDDVVEPLLVFPDDDVSLCQSTLQGICSETPAISPQVLASPLVAPLRKQRAPAITTTPTQKQANLTVDKKGKAISPRESHILSERQRRKGMNHLFTTLGSLLPDTFSKCDKSTIVSEIILYIQSLQKDLEELGNKRSEALRLSSSRRPSFNRADSSTSLNSNCTTLTGDHCGDGNSPKPLEMHPGSRASPNVVTSSCGSDMFITISSPKAVKSLFSNALLVIQQHKFHLLDANISSNSSMIFHYFHVKALNDQLPRDDTLQKELQKLTTLDPMAA